MQYGCMGILHMNTKLLKGNKHCFKRISENIFMIILPWVDISCQQSDSPNDVGISAVYSLFTQWAKCINQR